MINEKIWSAPGTAYQRPVMLEVLKHHCDPKENIFIHIRKRKLIFLNLLTHQQSSTLNVGIKISEHLNCLKVHIDPVYFQRLYRGCLLFFIQDLRRINS